VTADQVYADPSALTRLFVHQPGSKEVHEWRRRLVGALPLTHHGRTELINSIALAAFRNEISLDAAETSWLALDQAFQAGAFRQADLLWRAALNRAGELSRRYSAQFGTRSLDVLHVACALELQAKHFLSFDQRQIALAETVGLKRVIL
jgi:predicted nucleic acid-binding protein